MRYATQKGFTLVELLVVIAILGILSSIVLASLNSSRSKGITAAMQKELSDMRSAAELVYDSTGTYSSACEANTESGKLFYHAVSTGNNIANGYCIETQSSTYYHVTNGLIVGFSQLMPGPDRWAAALSLPNGKYYCVD